MTPDVTAPEPPATDAEPAPAAPPRRWRRTAVATTVACWLYLGALLSFWLLVHLAADRWWLATVAMFSPRWLYSLPLAVLLPAAFMLRRRVLWVPLVLATFLAFGPVMRLCVPWRRALPARAAGNVVTFRVATLNADRHDLNPAALRAWVNDARPDVVAIQAWSSGNSRLVFGLPAGTGRWYVKRQGELLLASRFPITGTQVYPDPTFWLGGGGALCAFDLDTPAGRVRLVNLHVATPRYGLLAVAQHGRAGAPELKANIDRRRTQNDMLRRWVEPSLAQGAKVIIAGDFNMPPDSTIYRSHWSDFSNAFSTAGLGFGNTHFTRHTAVRIDHVLAGPGLRFRRSWTGPYVGSAHRPVVADVEAPAGAS